MDMCIHIDKRPPNERYCFCSKAAILLEVLHRYEHFYFPIFNLVVDSIIRIIPEIRKQEYNNCQCFRIHWHKHLHSQHCNTMAPVQQFNCSHCNKEFTRKFNLKVHIQKKHREIITKLKCPLWPTCRKIHKSDGTYSSISNLRVHLRKHHPNDSIDGQKIKQIEIRIDNFRSDGSDNGMILDHESNDEPSEEPIVEQPVTDDIDDAVVTNNTFNDTILDHIGSDIESAGSGIANETNGNKHDNGMYQTYQMDSTDAADGTASFEDVTISESTDVVIDHTNSVSPSAESEGAVSNDNDRMLLSESTVATIADESCNEHSATDNMNKAVGADGTAYSANVLQYAQQAMAQFGYQLGDNSSGILIIDEFF